MRIILSCKQSFFKFPDTQTDCVFLLFLLFPSALSEGNLHFRPVWLGSLHVASSRRWIFSQLLTLSTYPHMQPQKSTCIYDGVNNSPPQVTCGDEISVLFLV